MQCGYLTFKRALPPDFLEAGYPNLEVALSMADLYTDELLRNVDRIAIGYYDIASLLSNDNLGKVIDVFNCLWNAIDAQRHPITDESVCRTFFVLLLIGAGLPAALEPNAASGGSAIEVDAGSRHWTLAFQFARAHQEVERLLREGADELRSRRCGKALHGKALKRAVLVFEEKARQFTAWQEL